MKHQFGNLSDKSIQSSLGEMARRAIVAGYVQVILYPIIVLTSDVLREVPWFWAAEVLLIAVAISRTVQLKYGHRLFSRPRGLLLWQLWFAFGAQGIAITWGLSTAYVFETYGTTIQAWSMLIICLGTLSLYAASYAFEIFNNLLFQSIILAPTMIILALKEDAGAAYRLSFAGVLFLVFSVMMALNLRKTEIKILQNYEELVEKDAQLEKSHAEAIHMQNLIRSMLGSIDESFVMLNPEGVCSNVASANSNKILGVDPIGLHLSDLLRLEGKEKKSLVEYYSLFFSTDFDFDELCQRLPPQLELDGGKKTLALKYHPMRSEAGELQYMILTSRDITAELKALAQIKEERERANMILRIHSNRPNFRAFLEEMNRLTHVLISWPGGSTEEISRDLHTLKGTALIFGVSSLSRMIYEFELFIRGYQGKDLRRDLNAKAKVLQDDFLKWKNAEVELFTQIGVFEGETFEFSSRKLSSLRQKFEKEPGFTHVFKTITQSLISNEFGELMSDFDFHVKTTAQKLDKKVRFEVKNPATPLYVSPLVYREALRPLVHLFNNALDHGLETPSERKRVGKSEVGTVTVRYDRVARQGSDWIRLEIEDDGSGVNVKKLRELLTSRGEQNVHEWTDHQVAMSIFGNGLSTRSNVTEISGQGIGMGSVSAAIQRAGGEITILKTDAMGTLFEILLPYKPPTENELKEFTV